MVVLRKFTIEIKWVNSTTARDRGYEADTQISGAQKEGWSFLPSIAHSEIQE
jgi:hypothetical protein